MSETREVLAPCPFCGCKARILETQTDVVVACEGCCVENHFINDIRDTGRSRAIAAWNRRALSARDERAEEREPTYGDLLSDVRTLCRILISECELSEASKILTQTIQARTAPPAAIRAGGTDGPK